MKLERLGEHESFRPPKGPLLLVIMDGIGMNPAKTGNAVALAHTPTLDRLFASCPHTLLRAHGKAVGLPSDRDMGNSEVGHNALGAGRIFAQGAELVNRSIASGELWRGRVWQELIAGVKSGNGTLHLIGLLSDGNVHSHIEHLEALLERAAEEGVRRIRLHVLLDGRDVPPTSSLQYIDRIESFLAGLRARGCDAAIASGGGRMKVTMDRYEADWSVVERGWRAHVHGEARPFASAREAIETFRREEPGIQDQHLDAFVITREGKPIGRIEDGDSVIFFNFRGDRAIEISRAFEEDDFHAFDRGRRPRVRYAGMMQYDGDKLIPKTFLVAPPVMEETISELLVHAGVTQFACSETQKYGHVTYFWNGNRSGAFDEKLETYLEVESDQSSFDERPWMKAAEITDAVVTALQSGRYRFLRLNFANGDMVGHTGSFPAARIAVETVDLCLARLLDAVQDLEGITVVTADHGNSDEMFDLDKRTGRPRYSAAGIPVPKVSHTLNPVPFIIHAPQLKGLKIDRSVQHPGLSNVAATLLKLLGFRPPAEYDPPLI
jgi:2,3-bisphosphoglycerate-independent phosphoglycerate mutase